MDLADSRVPEVAPHVERQPSKLDVASSSLVSRSDPRVGSEP